MKFRRPRGTNDIFGDKMLLWQRVERELVSVLRSYGYNEIRTPIFEATELFVRTVGEGTDIVSKEMYTFKDKKGRSLTLRPENTAPVMRAYLENGLFRRGGIAKFYYLGPMFRYDRPQAGRYREFHQIGAEAVGSSNPAVDAEIIDLCMTMLKRLGFKELELHLNSVGCPVCRPRFRKVLTDSLAEHEDELCENCRVRTKINPLRIFDCKECVDIKDKLPFITDYLCDDCNSHFERLKEMLREIGIDYILNSKLVRGLDYYTKTAFEIHHRALGAQSALCGGGRYDGLSSDCGGPDIPAVGFSAGMERVMEALPEDSFVRGELDRLDLYFAVLDDSCASVALSIAREVREAGFAAYVDLSGRNLKKQLKAASGSNARYVVIIGSNELEKQELVLKDLAEGDQRHIAFSKLAEELRGSSNEG